MSDAIVAAFNDAADWDEVLTAIKSNAAALLDDIHIENLGYLADDVDREQAVGLGVNEIKTLFGNFTSLSEIKAVVERQIDVEYAKFYFVYAFETSSSVEDMRAALEQVQLLYDDRESVIQEWSLSDNPAVKARAAELAAEPYTTVLRKIAPRLDDGRYLDALAAEMMSTREENGPFDTLDSLIEGLGDAIDVLGSESIVTPFNDAAGWEAMLVAIKDHASALLDPDHLDKLQQLSEEDAYEQAVGLGVTEIRTLFGDFTSPDHVTTVVEKQIDIVHGRLAGLRAINSAQDASSMAAALSTHVTHLHQQRQELIAGWINSGNEAAVARAIELEGETYSIILSEVSSQIGDEAYLAELTVRMQAARQGSILPDIDALIAALDMIDRAIDATYDAAITGGSSGSMNEGDLHSVGGRMTVEDGDWGENRFKTVEESELQKQFGTFAFNSITGEWGFTLNSAAQSLKEGQQVHQTLTVQSLDGTAVATITVTITGRNDSPEAAGSGNSASGIEDTSIMGHVPSGTDIDGDDLTYTLMQPVQGLTLSGDGTFSYQPTPNFNGTVTFQYQVVDAEGGTSQPRTFTITVSPVNDRPHDIVLSTDSVEENATAGTVVGTLRGFDIDDDALAFSLINDADGCFAISNGLLVVKDGVKLDHEQATTHTVTVQVKDKDAAAYQETFVIQVNDDTSERIIGSSSADILRGGSGRDALWGGLGNDQLTGGSGKDIFVFDSKANKSTNKDKIVDFNVKDDSLWLDNMVFTKIGKFGSKMKPVQLKKDFFVAGSAAKDKNDYLIYDSKKGMLSYDADGSGKGKAVEIATLSKKLAMTYKDFFVI
ncbi:Ig-like domain-containing protein [Microvirga sp. CF3062]|uniref:Ig-like domain-containing protein n=1 Tax=Microvirga sp. CF3062 TaxID=3110182 RepID=UPI002E7669EC|nr:Ig-like domain-containing protein [Microvirga sp. CF3062]MEE1658135.1 Ig-like domain-containing protein [Microvirga sp. CF3062]